jgi:hypothetical protein
MTQEIPVPEQPGPGDAEKPERIPIFFARPPGDLLKKDPEDFTPQEQAEFDWFVEECFDRIQTALQELWGDDEPEPGPAAP